MQSAKSFCECVSHPFLHISTPSACEQFSYSLFALHGFFFLSLFWVPHSSWFPWSNSPSLLGFVELAHIMTKPCCDRKLNSWGTIMSEVHWSALDALLLSHYQWSIITRHFLSAGHKLVKWFEPSCSWSSGVSTTVSGRTLEASQALFEQIHCPGWEPISVLENWMQGRQDKLEIKGITHKVLLKAACKNGF